MSSTNAPFGLRPAYHPSGTIRPAYGTIASGYSTTIYQNGPVKIGTDGTLQAAAATDRFIGSFQGVEYNTTIRPVVSNVWLANTTGTAIQAYYTADPYITYEIQGDGSIPATALGEQADFTNAGSGNATTGLSSATISASTAASGTYQLRIVGLTPGPTNNWGDAYTVVQVQIAKHQNVASQAAY